MLGGRKFKEDREECNDVEGEDFGGGGVEV